MQQLILFSHFPTWLFDVEQLVLCSTMKKLIGIGLQIFLILFSLSSFAEPCQLANCSKNHAFAPTNSTSLPGGGFFFVPLCGGVAFLIFAVGGTVLYFRQKNDQPEYKLLPQWHG